MYVQCLLFRPSRQSLFSLLSFRGRPRFLLPCLPSPFLLPAKPSAHTDKGMDVLSHLQSLPACSPLPRQRHLPREQGRAGWGCQGLRPLFKPRHQGPIPGERSLPLPSHIIPPRHRGASVFRAACRSCPKPHCLPASPVSPVPPPVGLDASSTRRLHLQPSPRCHLLPLPTRPQLNGEKRAQKYPFWGWGWVSLNGWHKLWGGCPQLTVREQLRFHGVEVEVASTGVLGVGAVGHGRPWGAKGRGSDLKRIAPRGVSPCFFFPTPGSRGQPGTGPKPARGSR